MTIDESNQVEELLRAWHRWQDGYRPALSGSRCDSTCRGYQIGNQWATPEERAQIADLKIWKRNSEQIDACVDGLSWQHRAAIHATMKNRQINLSVQHMNEQAGAAVWRNPRLPTDRDPQLVESQHKLYQQAKEQLFPLFAARGLIKALTTA